MFTMPAAHPSHSKDTTPFDPERFYQYLHQDVPPHYKIAVRTDIGIRRKSNQDAFVFVPLQGGFVGAICDGMGGYQGGDIASKIATSVLESYFQQTASKTRRQPFQALREAIQHANRSIHEAAQKNEKLRQMGSTIVALLVIDEQAYVAHVGDSRLYLLREGTLLQITRDHSAVERMKEQGKSTEKVKSNIITRVLGRLPEVDVECQPFSILLQEGDRFLLCSDGLTGMVSDEEILDILNKQWDPILGADRLIEQANERGAKDNTTVMLIDSTKPQRTIAWGFVFLFLLLGGLLLWPAAPSHLPSPAPKLSPALPDTRDTPLPTTPRYIVPRALLVPPSPRKKRKVIRKRRRRRKRRKRKRRRRLRKRRTNKNK